MIGLLVADIHLADRPPSIRTETYAEDILAKLRFTVDLAREEEVDWVCWAGDVFHLKAPARTSHALVQRTADVVKAYGVPLFIVPGNHDIQHDRLETLDRQPLGVLFKAGAIPLIGAVDGLYGIPWLQDWKRDLLPYMDEWEEGEQRLMVAHAPIVPPGQTRPFEYIDAADWNELMLRPGHVFYGHMHDPEGAFPVGASLFANYGALSRGSIHESTLKRIPTVALYSSDVGDPFQPVSVPYRPAEEVFRLADKEVEDAHQERLDEFLVSVGHTSLERVSVERVMKDLTERGVRPEVLDEAQSCFEEAR